jgi:hypothetical protein
VQTKVAIAGAIHSIEIVDVEGAIVWTGRRFDWMFERLSQRSFMTDPGKIEAQPQPRNVDVTSNFDRRPV